ncbi:MAG: hypothetical protein LIP04_10800 [Tannerellaceae bacterium]|nr:hypothetical protein [Tannerellaceae bacterium]
MPLLASISSIDLPFKIPQQEVKDYAHRMFGSSFPEVERILPVFDHTSIQMRNLCKPLDYYYLPHTFQERNRDYITLALDYSVEAVEKCLVSAQFPKEAVTDLIFVSSTGLATPGLDALIINKMRLNPSVNRMSVFGLGCGGGVSGYAKACTLAKANPHAVVLLVAVELYSLTFMRDDFSKSNFIGTTLFSDGVAACLITGDQAPATYGRQVAFVASESRLYYDTLDIMGWDFMDGGFKVVFSPDIPSIIARHVKKDVCSFLEKQGLTLADIACFIFYPGGMKVLAAYEEALELGGNFLETTREVMADYGNMSSTTVLYVLQRFIEQKKEPGYGLMASMGPGFSCELALIYLN